LFCLPPLATSPIAPVSPASNTPAAEKSPPNPAPLSAQAPHSPDIHASASPPANSAAPNPPSSAAFSFFRSLCSGTFFSPCLLPFFSRPSPLVPRHFLPPLPPPPPLTLLHRQPRILRLGHRRLKRIQNANILMLFRNPSQLRVHLLRILFRQILHVPNPQQL